MGFPYPRCGPSSLYENALGDDHMLLAIMVVVGQASGGCGWYQSNIPIALEFLSSYRLSPINLSVAILRRDLLDECLDRTCRFHLAAFA